jgi:WD40 repeat protein
MAIASRLLNRFSREYLLNYETLYYPDIFEDLKNSFKCLNKTFTLKACFSELKKYTEDDYPLIELAENMTEEELQNLFGPTRQVPIGFNTTQKAFLVDFADRVMLRSPLSCVISDYEIHESPDKFMQQLKQNNLLTWLGLKEFKYVRDKLVWLDEIHVFMGPNINVAGHMYQSLTEIPFVKRWPDDPDPELNYPYHTIKKQKTPQLYDEKNMLITAIEQDSKNIQYASEDLLKDKSIALILARKSPNQLKFMHQDLRKDPEIVHTAITSKLGVANLFDVTNFIDHPDILILILQHDIYQFHCLPDSLRHNKYFVLQVMRPKYAVSIDYAPVFNFISDTMQESMEIIQAALIKVWDKDNTVTSDKSFKYASSHMYSTAERDQLKLNAEINLDVLRMCYSTIFQHPEFYKVMIDGSWLIEMAKQLESSYFQPSKLPYCLEIIPPCKESIERIFEPCYSTQELIIKKSPYLTDQTHSYYHHVRIEHHSLSYFVDFRLIGDWAVMYDYHGMLYQLNIKTSAVSLFYYNCEEPIMLHDDWETNNDTGHLIREDGINDIAVSHDGQYLFTSSIDHTIGMWHLPTRQWIKRLACRSYSDTKLAVTDNDAHLYSLSESQIHCWDIHQEKIIHKAVCKDKSHRLIMSNSHAYTVSRQVITQWTLDLNVLSELTGHQYEISAICINQTGTLLYSLDCDSTLFCWDLKQTDQPLKIDLKDKGFEVYSPMILSSDERYLYLREKENSDKNLLIRLSLPIQQWMDDEPSSLNIKIYLKKNIKQYKYLRSFAWHTPEQLMIGGLIDAPLILDIDHESVKELYSVINIIIAAQYCPENNQLIVEDHFGHLTGWDLASMLPITICQPEPDHDNPINKANNRRFHTHYMGTAWIKQLSDIKGTKLLCSTSENDWICYEYTTGKILIKPASLKEHADIKVRLHVRKLTDLSYYPEKDWLISTAEDGQLAIWQFSELMASKSPDIALLARYYQLKQGFLWAKPVKANESLGQWVYTNRGELVDVYPVCDNGEAMLNPLPSSDVGRQNHIDQINTKAPFIELFNIK